MGADNAEKQNKENKNANQNAINAVTDKPIVRFGGETKTAEENQSPRKAKKDFKRSQHHFSPRASRRSLPGLKQARRRDNLNFLLSQLEDKDVDESGEVDMVDLIAHKNSVFAELFMDHDKMSDWNNFVNCSEDEQHKILDSVRKSTAAVGRRGRGRVQSESSANDGLNDFVRVNMDEDDDEIDQSHHAFLRISHRHRQFLRKKQFPKGELQKLEEELVDFFLEWPNSVYVTHLPDGFRRLLLHAVSQYLDLESRSFEEAPGFRQTQVENKSPLFSPPLVPLVTYLNRPKSLNSPAITVSSS